jgi:RNA polymerase sigma-70 factor (ECF subfamily)
MPSESFTASTSSPRAATHRDAPTDLGETCAQPLQAYLLQSGRDAAEAEELVKSFLAAAAFRSLLRKDAWHDARARSSLLAAFITWLPAAGSQPGIAGAEAAGKAYDREWASAILGRAMEDVRRLYEERGRLPVFVALRGAIPGVGQKPDFAKIAMDFGMTEEAVNAAAGELRASCTRFLRAEVEHTVADAKLVDDELGYLLLLVPIGK